MNRAFLVRMGDLTREVEDLRRRVKALEHRSQPVPERVAVHEPKKGEVVVLEFSAELPLTETALADVQRIAGKEFPSGRRRPARRSAARGRGPAVSAEPIPQRERFWTVDDLPCPECGEFSIIGYLMLDENGRHMHTRYRCTFWRSGVKPDLTGAAYAPCDWAGWTVPGWRNDEDAEAARTLGEMRRRARS